MRVVGLILKNFQQFNHLQLDFRDPDTGRAADKVCLIGPNGTGKSTILRCLHTALQLKVGKTRSVPHQIGAHIIDDRRGYWVFFNSNVLDLVSKRNTGQFDQSLAASQTLFLDDQVEQSPHWQEFLNDGTCSPDWLSEFRIGGSEQIMPGTRPDCIVYSAADHSPALVTDPPRTTLSEALSLRSSFPISHLVNAAHSADLWKLLIFLANKREGDWKEYLQRAENRKMAVEDVERAFNETHPQIFERISQLWNKILDKVGLEFDIKKVQLPVQLTDNLIAHVHVKGSDQPLQYNALSTGIRNFMFTLGYIAAIYFQKKIEHGFALIDEPENSLYPNVLYDIISSYVELMPKTQLFFATHSPIIAAQFKRNERVLLDFDGDLNVAWRHGVTPEGDDPNDVLSKDFDLKHLYHPEGERKWSRYLQLRTLIRNADKEKIEDRSKLVDEYLDIGKQYGFAKDYALFEEKTRFEDTH